MPAHKLVSQSKMARYVGLVESEEIDFKLVVYGEWAKRGEQGYAGVKSAVSSRMHDLANMLHREVSYTLTLQLEERTVLTYEETLSRTKVDSLIEGTATPGWWAVEQITVNRAGKLVQ